MARMRIPKLREVVDGVALSCLDVLLPPLCLSCGVPVGCGGALCATCWKRIHFIDSPMCQCCGLPFEAPCFQDDLCPRCQDEPNDFASARAAFVYDDNSREIVLGFKHGDQTHAALAFARWMARAGESYWKEANLIVPVPLHRWRLFRRRYNQSALLARSLAKVTGKRTRMQGLARIRATESQGHLDRKSRAKNVADAFVVPERERPEIRNATVVLIDDVMTTGATLNECARTLRSAGAKKVFALTLAKAGKGA